MSWNIEVEGGKSVRLPTAGKYCEQDIVVTATSDDLGKQVVERTITTLVNDQITKINAYGLAYCTKLVELKLSKCTFLNGYGLYHCTSLTIVDFANHLSIEHSAFSGCGNLSTVILRSNTMSSLSSNNQSVFTNTLIADGTGHIYVPAALVDTYKADNNWSIYANQIRAIEDYPDICGS
ncbi:MAG: leucine-rich repeat protein [Oscillospiraceae bacterium]|nr:leucine-rich repeat protein [Oscillospiraceae bacterium]